MCVELLYIDLLDVQAYQSLLMMAEAREKHPEFCIPLTMIPATISNNVPGTDFTLGTDTALNAICDVSSKVLCHVSSSSVNKCPQLFCLHPHAVAEHF